MATRFIGAALMTIVVCTIGTSDPAGTTSDPMEEVIAVTGGDQARHDEATAIIERFAAVGLDLPPVAIVFSDDPTDCRGHDGLIHYDQSPLVVSICSELSYVLPHELAHAWVHHHLDEAERSNYVAAWGLASWDDPDSDWNERGTEHAAFIIQQNVTRSAAPASSASRDRMAAFEMLTGIPSPLTL